jgi:hypothetical protein
MQQRSFFLWMGLVTCLHAQTPKTPTAFVPRNIDGSQDIQPNIAPSRTKDEIITRAVTHVVLGDQRQWASADGRTIEAKLIAFEDLVMESKKGVAPAMPDPPKYPTVVRDGNIRLSVNQKPVVISLSKLSAADQDYIEKIRVRHAAKP